MDLTAPERRVLGSLVEKQMTTPEHYPLTTNALVAAANQASNRNPVTDYDEATILEAVASLRERDLVRSVKRPEDRVMKHRHDLDRELHLDDEELAVVGVLLLRGAQTPGELRVRTDRYTDFTTGIDATLERLAGREEPLATALERRPGQKEARWAHRLGGSPAEPAPDAVGPARTAQQDHLADRVAALELAVAELQEALGL